MNIACFLLTRSKALTSHRRRRPQRVEMAERASSQLIFKRRHLGLQQRLRRKRRPRRRTLTQVYRGSITKEKLVHPAMALGQRHPG